MFSVRALGWMLLLAVITFFWVAVFDAGQSGFAESVSRTASGVFQLLNLARGQASF